jgi:hypothetical protein
MPELFHPFFSGTIPLLLLIILSSVLVSGCIQSSPSGGFCATISQTPAPSGLVIVMNQTEIPSNSNLELYLENTGAQPLLFLDGNPFTIEYFSGTDWIVVDGHYGTQGSWKLKPGEMSRALTWDPMQLQRLLDAGVFDRSRVRQTGQFRVCAHGFALSNAQDPLENEIIYCREFRIIP